MRAKFVVNLLRQLNYLLLQISVYRHVLSHHVRAVRVRGWFVALAKNARNELNEHHFVLVRRVLLQELLVALQFAFDARNRHERVNRRNHDGFVSRERRAPAARMRANLVERIGLISFRKAFRAHAGAETGGSFLSARSLRIDSLVGVV